MNGTAIDLFSGAGGVTTGLKLANARVISAVENDPIAAQTYRRNHGDVKLIEDDIRNVEPFSLLRRTGLVPGEITLLTACAPCQGFSSLGKRLTTDPRNDLVYVVLRFIEDLRPEFVAFENVPRLARDVRFADFVVRLRQLGYGVYHGIYDAADFHTPQRRRRLVLAAARGRMDCEVPELVTAYAPEPRPHTVRQAFACLPAIDSTDSLHRANEYSPSVLERIRSIPRDGGSRRDLPAHLWLNCHKRAGTSAGNSYGRMSWNAVSPTLTTRCTTPACGRFLHPEEDRAITLREAAALQSFPKNYHFEGGRMAVASQIGNAVPVHLSEAIWQSLTGSR